MESSRRRSLLAAIDDLGRTTLADLQKTLLKRPDDAREVFEAEFPGELVIEPVEHDGRRVWAIREPFTLSNDTPSPNTVMARKLLWGRRVWAIRGMAQLDPSTLSSDPTGT